MPPAVTAPLLPPPRQKAVTGVYVQPLRYWQLLRAMNTAGKAFASGSLTDYLREADTTPWAGICRWLSRLLSFVDSISRRRMLTIGGGTAFLMYEAPGSPSVPPWFVRFFSPMINKYRAAEYVKRKREYNIAVRLQAQAKEAFGAAVDKMYEIQGLATAPKAQGRGYGRLLVKTVTDMADAERRDTWVVTSDARSFYEGQGFSVVRTATLGADNPAWSGDPVEVYILRRAANAYTRRED